MRKFSLIIAAFAVLLLAGCGQPARQTAAVGAEATLAATATPAPTASPIPTATPAPTPEPTATPVPTPFTIALFPDTQASAYHEPKALEAMGKYIADHAAADNIVYVLHEGDLVDNGFADWQWKNFYLAYDQFADIVPFFPVAGNHDLGIKARQWDGYLAQPCVQDAAPDEQQFEDGKAAYITFNAGGTDFLVVGVGYSAEEASAAWVRDVFEKYPDHYGILLCHGYLHGRGELLEYGPVLYEQVVSRCSNLRLVLCGHFRGTFYREDGFDDDGDGTMDRTVRAMLCNYQGYKRNGGQIRLLTFDPADRSVSVQTFSTLTGHPMRDDYFKISVFRLENVF